MSDGEVDKVVLGLTCGDDVASAVFHGLRSLLAELTADDAFSTDGSVAHDLLEDGVGGGSDGDLEEQFHLEGFSLGG